MAYDFKKEFKEFYPTKTNPMIVKIPKMNFLAVRGKGNPNEEGSQYKQAINLLYPLAYTIKMSKNTDYRMNGYFDFVVPPLEGFWWQEGIKGVDFERKSDFRFISLLRLPDFVSKENFDWAIQQATTKKKMDFSNVEYFTYDEGLCVQCLHVGSYNDEPITVERMHAYMENEGYQLDITDERMHHEIYISDFRKTEPAKLKTILRHPIKKK
ncbi:MULTISPECIES: GyrI-like domain-containing protein [unclassified Parvimonas]|uniref:GyrI-like domain-containing protein n=1 Tax=unclassified Parvimonas TaxID=1151464 RepID=UPI002B4872BA|nr:MULTISPECIES: GyrI-like domain-containing protein [unclassified Parvimonas]MEB3024671.1 GyrI-like domain-containing protein [Parvimonas sp. M13]MEB3088816.1 GyrI-like domain-containing protein [Parvimonas sp. M20]